MSSEVYFEAQDDDSALCGQHAINNLLQGAYFTAVDLGHIGTQLDLKESSLYTHSDSDNDDNKTNNNVQYSNVSMCGLFSVDVLITALRSLNISALPISHPACLSANTHPSRETGFIFYQLSHWIAYRKINNIWYDLNSQSSYLLLNPQPVQITEFYLSAQMTKLQNQGFQVYVIRGVLPTLMRYAPKSNELKGKYQWYQLQDIQKHIDLHKLSKYKQDIERKNQTKQLMYNDPNQYQAYKQKQKQQLNNNNNDDLLTKIVKNPFSKLKNLLNDNKANNKLNNNTFLSDIEKAKKESLKISNNGNININTPVIEQYVDDNDDDDVQLALALSASIAVNNNNNKVNKSDDIQLQFEYTDHKPKIIQKQQKEHDFLDLMNSNFNNDNDNDNDDPFSALIREYSHNGNKSNNDKMNSNNNNSVNLLDFNYNTIVDNKSTDNDFMQLIDDNNNNSSINNPLISPNNNNNNSMNNVDIIERDIWMMLEKSLNDQ